jgi:DNA-3-methyladenine glycosylase
MRELSSEFFKRNTVKVAKELVGKILQVDGRGARIIETEAYTTDKASHARFNTARSKLMHETYGRVYVYFIYGMYHCLNVTTDTKPGAVLIRGIDLLNCNGPGKLCREMNITKKDNGDTLGSRIRILDDGFVAKVKCSGRIGIKQDMHLPWRFYIEKGVKTTKNQYLRKNFCEKK